MGATASQITSITFSQPFKTSKLCVTGLCAGNSPGTGEFPAQMASNAENVSIWWRHHVYVVLRECPWTRLLRQVEWLHKVNNTWRRDQKETFSALLALCAGNPPVSGEFRSQRPVTRSFDVSFDLRLIKRLSKHSRGWWFDTLSRPLWRHCNESALCGLSMFYCGLVSRSIRKSVIIHIRGNRKIAPMPDFFYCRWSVLQRYRSNLTISRLSMKQLKNLWKNISHKYAKNWWYNHNKTKHEEQEYILYGHNAILLSMITSSNGNIAALLAICAGNSPVTGEFPAQMPLTWSFDGFFDLRLKLSKQWRGWWFEMQSCPFWRHCNGSLWFRGGGHISSKI